MTSMTDEQKHAMQKVVEHMWKDEERDHECNPRDNHILTNLARLRELLEHEGIEVFPEPEWHKNFERQRLNLTDAVPS